MYIIHSRFNERQLTAGRFGHVGFINRVECVQNSLSEMCVCVCVCVCE